jgi:hypothetical protein
MTSLFHLKKYDWKEGRKVGGMQGSILHFQKRGKLWDHSSPEGL